MADRRTECPVAQPFEENLGRLDMICPAVAVTWSLIAAKLRWQPAEFIQTPCPT